MENKIQIFTTGGTIEGLDYVDDKNVPQEAPITVKSLIANIPNPPLVNIKQVFSKDSRFITKRDRDLLLREIELSKASQILITHGTLTMVETAQYIGQFQLNKTILLTGALISGDNPYSDATANLKFALESFDKLVNGTYIAMHKTLFVWDNVIKNIERNRFEKITK